MNNEFVNKEEVNMCIFKQVKSVPDEAKKKITGGRLNGMTDIKPMWRIQRLTEIFGPCGIGWKTTIKNKEIIDGANGEKIAIVDIDLFVKIRGIWSDAIEGTGGSSFVANEKNGLYTSDECFKMAYTDALSVACKSLGMGADVYWGDSKYNQTKEITKEDAENYVLDFGKHQGETLREVNASYRNWLYENKATCKQMLDLLGLAPVNDEETLQLIDEFENLVLKYDIDKDVIYKNLGVKNNTEMTKEQYEQVIKGIKMKHE